MWACSLWLSFESKIIRNDGNHELARIERIYRMFQKIFVSFVVFVFIRDFPRTNVLDNLLEKI